MHTYSFEKNYTHINISSTGKPKPGETAPKKNVDNDNTDFKRPLKKCPLAGMEFNCLLRLARLSQYIQQLIDN